MYSQDFLDYLGDVNIILKHKLFEEQCDFIGFFEQLLEEEKKIFGTNNLFDIMSKGDNLRYVRMLLEINDNLEGGLIKQELSHRIKLLTCFLKKDSVNAWGLMAIKHEQLITSARIYEGAFINSLKPAVNDLMSQNPKESVYLEIKETIQHHYLSKRRFLKLLPGALQNHKEINFNIVDFPNLIREQKVSNNSYNGAIVNSKLDVNLRHRLLGASLEFNNIISNLNIVSPKPVKVGSGQEYTDLNCRWYKTKEDLLELYTTNFLENKAKSYMKMYASLIDNSKHFPVNSIINITNIYGSKFIELFGVPEENMEILPELKMEKENMEILSDFDFKKEKEKEIMEILSELKKENMEKGRMSYLNGFISKPTGGLMVSNPVSNLVENPVPNLVENPVPNLVENLVENTVEEPRGYFSWFFDIFTSSNLRGFFSLFTSPVNTITPIFQSQISPLAHSFIDMGYNTVMGIRVRVL